MNTTALEPLADVFQTSAQQAFHLRVQALGGQTLLASLTLALPQPVAPQTLRAALDTLGRRHETLRTVYRYLPGMKWPVQSLLEEVPMVVLDNQPSVAEALSRSRETLTNNPDLALAAAQVEGQSVVTLVALACSFDEVSLRVLATELASLLRDEPLDDDEDALQYLDYSAWQEALREEDIGHQGAAFWRNLQQQFALNHRLPFEKVVEVSQQRRQAALTDAPWLAKVQRAAADQGVAAQSLALLLWSAFVARIAQQEKLLMGWQVDARNEQTATTLGRFARRMPVAFEHRSEQTLAQALTSFRASVEQSQSWLDCLNEFELSEQGSAPLRYGFVWQDLVDSGIEVDDGNPEVLRLRIQGEQLQLSSLDGAVPEPMLAAWLEQFVEFSRQLLASPELALAQANLLNESQQLRVIEGFNANASEQALPYQRLQELFSTQARLHPQRIAVTVNDQRLTYAELDARSNQVANALRAQGVGPEQVVAVYGQRSLEIVTALLGTLKAGAAYLPLDPNYPIERLTFMLADSGARHVLACQPLPDELHSEQVLSLMPDAEVWHAANTEPEALGDSANLAYVIYTSGSTGQPKGVMISHANAVASTLARSAFYQQPLRAFLMLSSFSFDSSVAGVFWTLGQGATLCLPDEDSYKDPARLAELIQREAISHYLTLPSYHGQILEHLDTHTLACVIVAGEACSLELAQRHRQALPDVALVNEYGPTEGTVWCSAWELPHDQDDETIPIGQPIAGMRLHVLGPELQALAVGAEGELYVGGAGIARGYLQRAALTAERFVPDPFAKAAGQRLYRTGDLARYRADGVLEYLGRVDHQVKIRGFRIELGEIESAMRSAPGIEDAAVIAREAPTGPQLLGFALSPADTAGIRLNELRSHLSEVLPEHMQPTRLQVLERFPLMPNGKLDRQALLDLDVRRSEFVAPRNDLEKTLVAIWAEALQVERVGVHDNFFELGGHSLLATRIRARIQDELNLAIPLKLFFEGDTLERLAAQIEQFRQHSEHKENDADALEALFDEVEEEHAQ
ncbi:non-ribosomal peptide synthetase [Pseudomonas vancouverensis]|uniref:Non-ribosomal peptide synthetase n=1 Tax=Pseudomonas vancouverensis TaxID=95300 RepID=A0A1H2MJQ7_PSEVA|nr:amino acid adenylation domain-containing protein [Pseudomonas vancouverensis]KAB0494813.1 amino acid adenylation domain-containing protein [Pseudomonas vancouverensis]TDB63545.1 non-ribosomal peptide synthetase [Pseudomonas vancouverensis]SDU93151.1 amino acid adenylation domain-containing protein [Pseudomonas vancouverensis]